ncbi:MAG: EI24 domain-containing protein [Planctomycetes bacterium]|nr:EI24 domain-containing protein [Planctomycetota bacterium]
MGRAISLALAQMFSGAVLGVLVLCALLSVATFVGVWIGIDYAIEAWWPETAESSWLAWLEGLATLVLAWFLFPVVASVFVALFLDHICAAVERRHYPGLPKAAGISIVQSLGVTLSYLAALVLANVLLLVLLLVFPPAYPVAWLVVNGWLVGREYLELVALRRMTPKEAKALHRRRGNECLATGAVIAFLMTMPFVNLIVPVFAAALMVHRYHDWRVQDEQRDRDYLPGG